MSKEKEQSSYDINTLAPSHKLWKTIWNLSIPPKVLNFMWRVAKNAILVKINLVKRHVLSKVTCDHYQSHLEDMLHALWLCPCLTKVWESDIVWRFRSTESLTDFQKLVLHVEEAGLGLELFSMIVWLLWQRRNQVRVGTPTIPLSQIVTRAQQQLQDFY